MLACRYLSVRRLIAPPHYPCLLWRLPEDGAHLIGQAATDATTLLAAEDNAGCGPRCDARIAREASGVFRHATAFAIETFRPTQLRSALGVVHAVTPAVAGAGGASRNAHHGR